MAWEITRIGLVKSDILSRKWIETLSSDWQQEWCGRGDVEKTLDKNGGGCEVQRGCAINSIMKMTENKKGVHETNVE